MSIIGSTRPSSNQRPLTCKANDSPAHHDDERILGDKINNIFNERMSVAMGWCQSKLIAATKELLVRNFELVLPY